MADETSTFTAYRNTSETSSANEERTAHATEYQAEKLDVIASLLVKIEKRLEDHTKALIAIEESLHVIEKNSN